MFHSNNAFSTVGGNDTQRLQWLASFFDHDPALAGDTQETSW